MFHETETAQSHQLFGALQHTPANCRHCACLYTQNFARGVHCRSTENRAGTSPVNAVVRETIMEKPVHLQSRDWKWTRLSRIVCVRKQVHSEAPALLVQWLCNCHSTVVLHCSASCTATYALQHTPAKCRPSLSLALAGRGGSIVVVTLSFQALLARLLVCCSSARTRQRSAGPL